MERNVLNFNGIVKGKVISVGIDVHNVSSQKGSTPKTVVSVVSSCFLFIINLLIRPFLAASSCSCCSAHDAHLFPFYSPLNYGIILADIAITRDAPAHT